MTVKHINPSSVFEFLTVDAMMTLVNNLMDEPIGFRVLLKTPLYLDCVNVYEYMKLGWFCAVKPHLFKTDVITSIYGQENMR